MSGPDDASAAEVAALSAARDTWNLEQMTLAARKIRQRLSVPSPRPSQLTYYCTNALSLIRDILTSLQSGAPPSPSTATTATVAAATVAAAEEGTPSTTASATAAADSVEVDKLAEKGNDNDEHPSHRVTVHQDPTADGGGSVSATTTPPAAAMASIAPPQKELACSQTYFTTLQFELLWVLTNIASGASCHCDALVSARLFEPQLLRWWLRQADVDLKVQALWFIANMTGDSAAIRDYFLSTPDVLSLVVNLAMDDAVDLRIRGKATFAMSSTCSQKPVPDITKVACVLPACAKILREPWTWKRLQKAADEDVLLNALWCVAYSSDGPNARVSAVVDSGVMEHVIRMLNGVPLPPRPADERPHEYVQPMRGRLPLHAISDVMAFLPAAHLRRTSFACKDWWYDTICCDLTLYNRVRDAVKADPALQNAALRSCGNIVTGSDIQTQYILDLGFVPFLSYLVRSSSSAAALKEGVWALSNIVAGTPEQQLLVHTDRALVSRLVDLVDHTDSRVGHEAVWVISNAFDGSAECRAAFEDAGAIVALWLIVARAPSFTKLREKATSVLGEALNRPTADYDSELFVDSDTEVLAAQGQKPPSASHFRALFMLRRSRGAIAISSLAYIAHFIPQVVRGGKSTADGQQLLQGMLPGIAGFTAAHSRLTSALAGAEGEDDSDDEDEGDADDDDNKEHNSDDGDDEGDEEENDDDADDDDGDGDDDDDEHDDEEANDPFVVEPGLKETKPPQGES